MPTPEQQAAIDCEGNVVVTARPGSGKTFTLARMIVRETSRLLSYQGIIAISYTNKASNELRDRCDGLSVEQNRSFFGTIDKFCMGQIVAPFAPHITGMPLNLNLVKSEDCSEWELLNGREVDDPDLRSFILRSFDEGRMPIEALGAAALLVLELVPQAELFVKSRYTSIFIDEYQDCGLYQHLLMKRLVLYGLRGIAVGDIDQAIFRFAGKSPKYLVELINSGSFKHFRLTKNHRCDMAIQSYSLALLNISSDPLPPAERRVFAIHMQGGEETLARGIRGHLPAIMQKYGIKRQCDVAIIGRGNGTLDRIGDSLGLPYKRFKETPLDKNFSKWRRIFSNLLSAYYSPAHFSGRFVEEYVGSEVKPSRRNRGIALVEEFFGLAEDELANRIELAVEIARFCESDAASDDDIEAYQSVVEDISLLRDSYQPALPEEISVLTYHKAKGLEYDVVFCLEAYRFIMPPPHYKKEAYDSYEESLCMHYVGITRAKKVCYIMLGTERHNAQGNLMKAIPSEFLDLPGLPLLRNESLWKES